jgi:hypothetical protein
VGELNRRMVRTPCRILPASYFPQVGKEQEKKCSKCGSVVG